MNAGCTVTETEWTLATGLRRATIHLLIWSAVCLTIWIVAVLLITPLIEMLPEGGRGSRRIRGLVTLLAAGPMAWLCVRWVFEQMQESTGFNSLILSVSAVVSVWVIAFVGVIIANAIRKPQVGNGMLWIGLGGICTVWIVYETYADN
jgi:hypothetical protein